MSKYRAYEPRFSNERPWTIHPIWRGIGCLLIILIPIMAYAAGLWFKTENEKQGWIPVPAELDRYINLSQAKDKVPVLTPAFEFIEGIYLLDVVLTIVFIIVGFALMTLGYSFLYRFIGPPRYGPLDSPPIKKGAYRR